MRRGPSVLHKMYYNTYYPATQLTDCKSLDNVSQYSTFYKVELLFLDSGGGRIPI
ncbi:hypothetical protein KL86SPO_30672 [uncultured Sporomusa sp.]|uniref:Uncharacterized protein n=1 Tax=uncultured Sporomusa sp. TaxID=307249 RepID=A0A212LSA2_9FIRM|nr:hypothetical protein KL86SPO_30672 [uncultured Sporomusa sp.]